MPSDENSQVAPSMRDESSEQTSGDAPPSPCDSEDSSGSPPILLNTSESSSCRGTVTTNGSGASNKKASTNCTLEMPSPVLRSRLSESSKPLGEGGDLLVESSGDALLKSPVHERAPCESPVVDGEERWTLGSGLTTHIEWSLVRPEFIRDYVECCGLVSREDLFEAYRYHSTKGGSSRMRGNREDGFGSSKGCVRKRGPRAERAVVSVAL